MLIGIDPFHDDTPLKVYDKIIAGKIKFYKSMDRAAKSLIKHLCQVDITKRFGCMKGGAKEIMDHRLFRGFEWEKLTKKRNRPFVYPSQKSKYKLGCAKGRGHSWKRLFFNC
eukprot:TRINITY_DN4770_c0_g1_i2.p4 TRINITY_DN4770_c0_g1~~TRINITY_DN4770_c0_g1_i2.p4  ORF type:complete len:112 (-),score=18.78 TRINITY_DN4770_c0_g1_i2:175-510(-)